NNITQENRNPLLFRDIGADGLKTGHTDQSGYALAASAVVDDRRIVLVISGLKSKRARAIESERLLRSAATNWTQHSLYDARDAVAQLPVLFGDQRYIAVGAKRDISLALRMEDLQSLKTELEYTSPLTAPVGRDQLVGRLVFSNDQGVIKTYPLYTLTASERVSRLQQAFLSLGYFFSGNMHGL
ncbi:MAG: hypothetical protein K0U36_02280, partial [Alphaproteobacteria bacterium]|nr:hypothetical protein [Alphaproteobacteria bacterium]